MLPSKGDFDHCCQYSAVCISRNRDFVRSKANISSSPVKMLAARSFCKLKLSGLAEHLIEKSSFKAKSFKKKL